MSVFRLSEVNGSFLYKPSTLSDFYLQIVLIAVVLYFTSLDSHIKWAMFAGATLAARSSYLRKPKDKEGGRND